MRRGGRRSIVPFALVALAVTVSLALLSPWAADSPDGLNKVAEDKGLSATADDHALEQGPLAGYKVDGVHDARLSKGLSGIIGIALTFAIAGGAIAFARRSRLRKGSS
jgi:hypothetical protein